MTEKPRMKTKMYKKLLIIDKKTHQQIGMDKTNTGKNNIKKALFIHFRIVVALENTKIPLPFMKS